MPLTARPAPRLLDQARQAQAQEQALLKEHAELFDDLSQAVGEARVTKITGYKGGAHPTATNGCAGEARGVGSPARLSRRF